MSAHPPPPAALLALVALLAGRAGAQASLLDVTGTGLHEQSGSAVDGAGDVDGDGRADLIIGAWRNGSLGPYTGRVSVHSGADGSILHEWFGDQALGQLGFAVCGLGDVDGDGRDDVALGAPESFLAAPATGFVRVHSGADGQLLYELRGSTPGGAFGYAVRPAGDVNGDGTPDLIVGAPAADTASVHSGIDGALLLEFHGSTFDFGTSVDGAGDVDGDGVPDLVVGEPNTGGFDVGGRAYVYSGASGALLHALGGTDFAWVWFGHAVAGAGDVNGDGHADVIVGAPVHEVIADFGSARVFSGADGSLLHHFQGGTAKDCHFGWAVRGVGDLDGDGRDDVAMATRLSGLVPSFTPGLVQVRSGATGAVLAAFAGDAPADQLGRAIGLAGDVNGDGRADLILGAPVGPAGQPGAGYARVVPCCDFLGELLCSPAEPNGSGAPGSLTANGSAWLGDNDVVLTAASLPLESTVLFLVAREALDPPFGGHAGVCLVPPLGRVGPATTLAGIAHAALDLTDLPVLGALAPGDALHAQAVFRDVDGALRATDALRLQF